MKRSGRASDRERSLIRREESDGIRRDEGDRSPSGQGGHLENPTLLVAEGLERKLRSCRTAGPVIRMTGIRTDLPDQISGSVVLAERQVQIHSVRTGTGHLPELHHRRSEQPDVEHLPVRDVIHLRDATHFNEVRRSLSQETRRLPCDREEHVRARLVRPDAHILEIVDQGTVRDEARGAHPGQAQLVATRRACRNEESEPLHEEAHFRH